MGLSHRHHYIPQFLIKNFADTDNLIHVYNKQKGHIVTRKQSSKSVFFELDRNMINFNGVELDSMEKMYSDIDTKFAPDLKNVLNSKKFTPEELITIVVLAYTLKWRIPLNDQRFNELKNNTTLEELSISITVKNKKDEIDEKVIKAINESEIFKEAKRFVLPLLPLINNPERLIRIYENSYIHTNSNLNSLIGDCPIIEKPCNDIHNIDSFIFPLSSTDTFIYKINSNKKVITPLFYINRDLATFHLSEKYVACKSKDYLENIVSTYNKIKTDNQIEHIMNFIFDFV